MPPPPPPKRKKKRKEEEKKVSQKPRRRNPSLSKYTKYKYKQFPIKINSILFSDLSFINELKYNILYSKT